ncbi:MAG: radical SAM protein [Candidatus Omnitrophica bacterium]|nr:radical SAM protein [Candidatus Omnitrophota bacterium]
MKFVNSIFNLYILKNRPISLVHFITNRCSARCRHCFIDFDNPDTFKNELSLQEIKRLTKSFGKSLLNVNLTGGEPFLREDIFEITKAYFQNADIRSVYISTNGMFTDRIKYFIDQFIDSNIKRKVIFSISIDNFEHAHDQYRCVKGLFDNAMKTYYLVKDCNSSYIIGNIAITITDHNYNDVIELYYYLKQKGVNSITATILREQGVVKNIALETKQKILKIYSRLTGLIHDDLFKKKLIGFKKGGVCGVLMDSKNMILDKAIEKMYLGSKSISSCYAASLFGMISADGTVYPCEILNQPLGNLRDYGMDFMKLWNDERIKECRKFIRDTKCNCVYGCAWTINIIANPIFLPKLVYNFLKQKL